jgi:predicted nucleic acid-binding protein
VRIVLDASALIAMLVRETATEAAFAAVGQASTVLCLRLTIAEVGNALSTKVRRGLIPANQASAAIDRLPLYFTQLLDDETMIAEALELSVALNHAVYDCLYAIASRREGATLVTADKAFAAKLGAGWDVMVL